MLYNAHGQPYTALVNAPRQSPGLVGPSGAPLAPVTPAPARIPVPVGSAHSGQRITVLVASNPKLPGSKAASRFDLYVSGMSVGQFVAACKAAGHTNPQSDLRYNVRHGFIRIG